MKRSKDFIKRKIGTQYVIVAVGAATKKFNGMISVNSTGSFIWDQLEQSMTMDELVNAFGESVMNADGSLNRIEMRNIAFMTKNKQKNLKLLNAITHKFVLSETLRRINDFKEQGLKAVIADVPLLFESGFDKQCDVTVAVISDEAIRIDRIMNRDNLPYDHAKNRIKSQISDLELSGKVDFVIENNGGIDELKLKVVELYNRLI